MFTIPVVGFINGNVGKWVHISVCVCVCSVMGGVYGTCGVTGLSVE